MQKVNNDEYALVPIMSDVEILETECYLCKHYENRFCKYHNKAMEDLLDFYEGSNCVQWGPKGVCEVCEIRQDGACFNHLNQLVCEECFMDDEEYLSYDTNGDPGEPDDYPNRSLYEFHKIYSIRDCAFCGVGNYIKNSKDDDWDCFECSCNQFDLGEIKKEKAQSLSKLPSKIIQPLSQLITCPSRCEDCGDDINKENRKPIDGAIYEPEQKWYRNTTVYLCNSCFLKIEKKQLEELN